VLERNTAQLWSLESRGNGNHWLLVNLIGSVSNRDGIGAMFRSVTEDESERFALVSTTGVIYPQATSERILAWDQRRS
jgi:hypothetical protein